MKTVIETFRQGIITFLIIRLSTGSEVSRTSLYLVYIPVSRQD